MPVPAILHPGAVKVKRIACAVGYRCEICQDECAVHLLEIHFIPGREPGPCRREDPHRWILVLCPRCHREVHNCPCTKEEQAYLVSLRDPGVAREIRRILRSRSRPYSAPDTFDPERFFSDPSPVPWGWVV
jgi:hypothetical protein